MKFINVYAKALWLLALSFPSNGNGMSSTGSGSTTKISPRATYRVRRRSPPTQLAVGTGSAHEGLVEYRRRPDSKDNQKGCRLKLYWREGYNWQSEKKERKWCLQEKYNRPLLLKCSSSSSQQWILNEGDRTIRLANDNKQCMETRNKDIVVRSCGRGNKRQQFNFKANADKFEIRKGNWCMTNRHHPKAYETMSLEPCRQARKSDTSLWECY
jgi:hypothetical protein